MQLLTTEHTADGTTRRYNHPKHGRINVKTHRADPDGADIITIVTKESGFGWLRVLAHEQTVEDSHKRHRRQKARARANGMIG